MPRVPQVSPSAARVSPQRAPGGLPQITHRASQASPEAFGAGLGRGLQAAGQGVDQISRMVQGHQRAKDNSDATAAYTAYLGDLNEAARAAVENPDPFAGGEAWKGTHERFIKQHTEGLTPAAAAILKERAGLTFLSRDWAVRNALRHGELAHHRSTLITGLDDLENQAAFAQTQAEFDTYVVALSDMIGESVASGWLAPDKGAELRILRTERLVQARDRRIVNDAIKKDPEVFLAVARGEASNATFAASGIILGEEFAGARVTGRFGEERTNKDGTRLHWGIDWAVPTGTRINAVADGKIVSVKNDPDGYGQWVEVEHAGGIRTRYAHLSAFSVKVGDKVARGQEVGLSGNTGRSTGPHLHFEVRKDGRPIDPTGEVADNALGNVNNSTLERTWARMTPEERDRAVAGAEKARASIQAERRHVLAPIIDDHRFQLAQGIVPSEAQRLSQSEFGEAGLSVEAFDEYNLDWDLGEQMKFWHTRPMSAIDKEVAEQKPITGQDGFQAQSARWATAVQAADRIAKLRQADPAAYVTQFNPGIQEGFEAWRASGKPEDFKAYTAASIAEQERLGIDKPRALPTSAAKTLVQQFGEATGADQQLATLLPVTVGIRDDALGRRILSELTEAGLPVGVAHALDRAASGDISAAKRIVAVVGAEEVKPQDKAEHKRLVSDAYADYSEVLAAQSRWTGQPARALRAAQEADLIGRMSAVTGDAEQAATDLLGHQAAVFDEDLAALIVPADTDEGTLLKGLEVLREQQVTGDTFLLSLRPDGGAVALQIFDTVADGLRGEARWVNLGDGFGLALPGGGFLAGPDQQPIIITIEQAIEAGSA